MTLQKNTDFTTDDPEQLRTDLQLEHVSIRDELARVDDAIADRWKVVNVGDAAIARAVPYSVFAGVTFTVRPPGKPRPGDVFGVVGAPGCSITIQSDDGSSVQGNAGGFDSIGGGASGWFRWIYVASPNPALQGWWR